MKQKLHIPSGIKAALRISSIFKSIEPARKRAYLLVMMVLLMGIRPLMAQITDLHDFSFNSNPYGNVTVSGCKLFGSSNQGGKNGFGYFFSVNKDGSGFKDIWDCNDTGSVIGNSNGGYPYGDVTVIGNKLYCFNEDGGAFGYGNIFRIDSDGKGYKDLHDFNDTTGANMMMGALTRVGNKFYGMTYGGGAYGYGVIFSIDTNGAAYKDLFDFNGINGANPQSVTLAISKNKLYGITCMGGVKDSGVIFSIDTNGSGYKDLVDLNYSKGFYPYGSLTLVGNKFFGTTYEGGAHDSGVAFEINTNGTEYKKLVDMDSATGCFPQGSLIFADNKLYSETYQGGVNNSGTIFSIDTNGAGYKIVYNFEGTSSAYYPENYSLTLSNDTLFGIISDGGLNGYGELFMLQDTKEPASIAAIKEPNSTVNVYPNPNNGVFNIQIADSQQPLANSHIEVYNMLGEKVYSAMANGQMQVDLSNNAGGTYAYRLLTAEGNLVSAGKVIIQK
jgi:uncharacterized repeat protein (TIGR03803 family)